MSVSHTVKDSNCTGMSKYQATWTTCKQRKKKTLRYRKRFCTIFLTCFAVWGNTNKTTIKHLSIAELPSLLRTNWLVSKRVGPGNQEKAQSIKDSAGWFQQSTNYYLLKKPGVTQLKPLKEKTSFIDYNGFCTVHFTAKWEETVCKLCSMYAFFVTKCLSFNSQEDMEMF